MDFTKENFVKALIRAVRTFAQTAVSMVTVGQAFVEINWMNVLSVSAVAAIISLLMSVAFGLPEADEKNTDGTLYIKDDGEKQVMLFSVESDPEQWQGKNSITLKIDNSGNMPEGLHPEDLLE